MTITYYGDDMVSDTFEREYDQIVFRDAIVMPRSEYDALTQEQLDAIKQERFDAWVAFVFPPLVEEA